MAPWPSDKAAAATAAAAAATVPAAVPAARSHADGGQGQGHSEQKSDDQPRKARGRSGRHSGTVPQSQQHAPPPGLCAMGLMSPVNNRPALNRRPTAGGAAAAPPAYEAGAGAGAPSAIPLPRSVCLGGLLAYFFISIFCAALWALGGTAASLAAMVVLSIAPLAAAAFFAVSASSWATWQGQGQGRLRRARVDTATNRRVREHSVKRSSSWRPLQERLFGGGDVGVAGGGGGGSMAASRARGTRALGSGGLSGTSPARARTPGGTRRGRLAWPSNRRRDSGSRSGPEARTTSTSAAAAAAVAVRTRGVDDANAVGASRRRCDNDRRSKQ